MENNKYITEYDILDKAIHECLCELYKRAQPSINLDEVLKYSDKPKKIYDHYYLSDENYRYITNMYLEAYGFKSHWEDNCETIKNYLINGGTKISFIPNENKMLIKTYDKTSPLSELIGEENSKLVEEGIKNCKEYFLNNHLENSFRFSVMNSSPTSNKQQVIDYWKKEGKDIIIKDYDIEKVYFYEED